MNLIPRRPTRHVALAMSLLVFAMAAPTTVLAHGPDPVLSDTFFEQDAALRFDWRSGAEPPASLKTAIRAAAADASTTRRSRAATFVYDAAGSNPIGYGTGATCGPNGIACFTRNAPKGFTMWFREQGHRFDWGRLKWCQAYGDPPSGCFDVETIALDEFGHVEGLDHHVNYGDERDYDDAVVQTVSRAKPSAGWNMHSFGRCDVATLQREYDVATASTKLSTCLDVATTLTIAASPASIAYGGTTTTTATMRVASLASLDRLRSNPLSNRTVSLQRRSPGSATWTTVGTMTPGASGTYRLAVKLQARTEFRAVFKAPSDEGLLASTSGQVTVVVAPCTVGPCPLREESPT